MTHKHLKPAVLAVAMAVALSACGKHEQAAAPAPAKATTAATAAAAAPPVKLGVEVLLSERQALVQGKRVGLITNVSATDHLGRSDIDLLARAPGVKLAALFAPEHGVRAALDMEDIPNGKDPATGVPIYSLYGEHRAPTAAQVAKLDVLVFDIQDSGSRFYTYTTTLGLCLEAARKLHKPFIVLDRPNPITGVAQGDMLDPAFKHFTGRYALTTRHGMTIGELARYINGEERVGADLTVVPMQGDERQSFLELVDRRLYQAKQRGRNMTVGSDD